MTDLERRYLRLIRLCYPAGYRLDRGAEIAGTYLDLAGPDRRWPSVADVADLVRGGLRQRVRATGHTGLVPGVRLAALLALIAVAVLATGGTMLELHPYPVDWGVPPVGPFATLGFGVWVTWLLAVAVFAVAPGRATRVAVAVALLLTVAVVPVSGLSGQNRPALSVLLAQAALGVVALGLADRVPLPWRLLPVAAAAATVGVLWRADFPVGYYGNAVGRVLPAVAVALLLVAMLAGAGLAVRGDHRGGWTLLVLLGPAGMLALEPLSVGLQPTAHTWAGLATTAVIVAVIAPALLAVAVTGRRRLKAARCPECGRSVL
ncbi:hypothetical protein [Paractinoplanes rishiriensis]|uniref:Uncharacterized protein n=1 Tax=Paractinoplanes rishiriensis TaxID=1050105 RepID=A0A919K8B8_9ACTN|nr:hypothetical protein [Actinoplanes rishiriensis]GIF01909.1 hypothetical protein Ari01nite_93730 [Actinoplanes rishiriensis]